MNTIKTIIYYPTIKLPQDTWLKQTLLYWDQVATIVPIRFHTEESYNRVKLLFKDPAIKYLVDENAYRTIWADRAFMRNHDEHRKMVEEFYNIINSPEYISFIGPNDKWKIDSEIFADKILNDTLEYLKEKKLAKENNYRYFIERKTALLYMSLLAKYLADIETPLATPATDMECYRDFIYFPTNVSRANHCLGLILNNMFPIPKIDVSLKDIIKFKKRRKLELLKFREVIWQFENDLGKSANNVEAYEVCIKFQNRIKIEMAELNQILTDSKISTVLGTLKSLIDLKSPALWTTAATLSGKEIVNLPTNIMWTGVVTFGIIQVGAHLINERNKNRAAMRNSAFSYLYHVNKNL